MARQIVIKPPTIHIIHFDLRVPSCSCISPCSSSMLLICVRGVKINASLKW